MEFPLGKTEQTWREDVAEPEEARVNHREAEHEPEASVQRCHGYGGECRAQNPVFISTVEPDRLVV